MFIKLDIITFNHYTKWPWFYEFDKKKFFALNIKILDFNDCNNCNHSHAYFVKLVSILKIKEYLKFGVLDFTYPY